MFSVLCDLGFDFVYVCQTQHAEMADESVQLKTLQTILIIFQSRLHPYDEVTLKIRVWSVQTFEL